MFAPRTTNSYADRHADAPDTSGNLLSSLRYTAFGEVRAASGTTSTGYRYTGLRNEAEIGLYNYVARF